MNNQSIMQQIENVVRGLKVDLTDPETQLIIEKTYDYLVKQGGPSIDSQNDCVYRGIDGKKCAVGMWIKDEVYDKIISLGAVIPGQQNTIPRKNAIWQILGKYK